MATSWSWRAASRKVCTFIGPCDSQKHFSAETYKRLRIRMTAFALKFSSQVTCVLKESELCAPVLVCLQFGKIHLPANLQAHKKSCIYHIYITAIVQLLECSWHSRAQSLYQEFVKRSRCIQMKEMLGGILCILTTALYALVKELRTLTNHNDTMNSGRM